MEHPAPHGIMFHHFHGIAHNPGQGSISAADFDAILRHVGLERILGPDEWIERVVKGTLTADHTCITFDDSLLCQFDIALPVLDKYGLKAFWFVYSAVFENVTIKLEVYRKFRSTYFESIECFYRSFFARLSETEYAAKVERVSEEDLRRFCTEHPLYSISDARYQLTRDRALNVCEFEAVMDSMIVRAGTTVLELSRGLWMNDAHLAYLTNQGHEVGLHSYSHPMVLGELSTHEQEQEYRRNYDHLSRVCGRSPRAMSHPSNSYNDSTLRILEHLGICCGFRANMLAKVPGQPLNQSPYELAREDHMNILPIATRGVTGRYEDQ